MELYDYQKRVKSCLLNGKSVILQAPTGSGKTRAALAPFIEAFFDLPADAFPRKCVYSVPMRVLASQFYREYGELAARYERIHRRSMDVQIQTGAQALDPRLEGDLIFTTIDQTLSNFLNIPYALGGREANLNAGAVLSSYLVFDELHLFDPDSTLPTTLHMLELLRGIVPFLVMTATFSHDRLQALARSLNAEAIVLSDEEANTIPSQHKTRRVHAVDEELTASAVLEQHRSRSIAICNTVARAQALYDDLQRQAPESAVRLLHSRFLRTDRDRIESWLEQEFGKDRGRHTLDRAILVATQAIEVGVNISSEALHTELAPAASVLQRAGRCARYEGEEGQVFVYRLPPDKTGNPNYMPYHEGSQREICERTWHALHAHNGEAYDFGKELAVVDEAHGLADRRVMETLSARRFAVMQDIHNTIATQDRSKASRLIRDVDSRTIIVHPEPEKIENPWAYEGFGLHRGSLYGAFDGLQALADQIGADWVMRRAEPLPEEEGMNGRTVWRWPLIRSKDDLTGALLVVINPALAEYTREVGFCLGMAGDETWSSPLLQHDRAAQAIYSYRRETIQEHVARMVRVCDKPFVVRTTGLERQALFAEFRYALSHLEAQQGWPEGTLERLARLMLVAHDLGKLDVRWQKWAHQWQEEVSRLRGADLRIPADYLAAHTDSNPNDPEEKALGQRMRGMRPNHAAESAAAVVNVLAAEAGSLHLARAGLTAIIAHHSPGATGEHEQFQAHSAAPSAFPHLLTAAGLPSQLKREPVWGLKKGAELVNRKVDFASDEQLLAYLYLARILRLADYRSQAW